MRALKRRRNLVIVLAFAGVFGGSADHSHSVVAAVAAAEKEATSEQQQHKDLIERYLQAISEQDGSGAAAVAGASEENESCFDGWDASCQDDPSFLSVMGASCRLHLPFDCTMLHAIGYSEQEVYDVINNCPCACKVPCGQWTFTPSAEPSSSPSSTPSASPRCGTFDTSTYVLILGKINVLLIRFHLPSSPFAVYRQLLSLLRLPVLRLRVTHRQVRQRRHQLLQRRGK